LEQREHAFPENGEIDETLQKEGSESDPRDILYQHPVWT